MMAKKKAVSVKYRIKSQVARCWLISDGGGVQK